MSTNQPRVSRARTQRQQAPRTKAQRPKAQRVPVRMPDETPSGHWFRSIRLSGFAITALALIVLSVVVLAPSLKVFVEQRQQIAALQASVTDAKKAVSDLKSQKARWSDPNYIEAQARERLSYVMPGDYSYIVQDDVGASADTTLQNGQPISDKIQTTDVDWVSSMLSSVFTAGLTDAPTSQLVAPVVTGGK